MDKLDFNEIISKHLSYSSHGKRKIGRYYPSEVGSCLRKIFYNILIPKEKDPDLLKVFAVGNIFHDFVADVIRSNKTDSDIHFVAEELPFLLEREGYVISGRIDDLILVRKGTKLMLIEVKSTKSVDVVLKKNKPYDSHKDQLILYMYAMGLQKGGVLYIEKNTLKTHLFDIEYKEEDAQRILTKFDKIHYHLSNHILPPAEAKEDYNTKWLCNYCDFKDECQGCFVPLKENQSEEENSTV